MFQALLMLADHFEHIFQLMTVEHIELSWILPVRQRLAALQLLALGLPAQVLQYLPGRKQIIAISYGKTLLLPQYV